MARLPRTSVQSYGHQHPAAAALGLPVSNKRLHSLPRWRRDWPQQYNNNNSNLTEPVKTRQSSVAPQLKSSGIYSDSTKYGRCSSGVCVASAGPEVLKSEQPSSLQTQQIDRHGGGGQHGLFKGCVQANTAPWGIFPECLVFRGGSDTHLTLQSCVFGQQ